jgi:ER membrane protein complex subunit 8/9
MDIHMTKQAYCKLFLHLAKYPYSSCNGLLLAKRITKKDGKDQLKYVDCIPLFHSALTLSPSLEVALWQIDCFCQKNDLEIAGYYQANENSNDNQ